MDGVWVHWNTDNLKTKVWKYKPNIRSESCMFYFRSVLEGISSGAVTRSTCTISYSFILLLNLLRVMWEKWILQSLFLHFCPTTTILLMNLSCNHRECQVWLMWWTHLGCMLREYLGFITPTPGVSLVYLRIEELSPSSSVCTHCCLDHRTEKETVLIFYKWKVWNQLPG